MDVKQTCLRRMWIATCLLDLLGGFIGRAEAVTLVIATCDAVL
jgi:hypothetical protein